MNCSIVRVRENSVASVLREARSRLRDGTDDPAVPGVVAFDARVMISIPLSILSSLVVLHFLGET